MNGINAIGNTIIHQKAGSASLDQHSGPGAGGLHSQSPVEDLSLQNVANLAPAPVLGHDYAASVWRVDLGALHLRGDPLRLWLDHLA